jgi:hypothetical protein
MIRQVCPMRFGRIHGATEQRGDTWMPHSREKLRHRQRTNRARRRSAHIWLQNSGATSSNVDGADPTASPYINRRPGFGLGGLGTGDGTPGRARRSPAPIAIA